MCLTLHHLIFISLAMLLSPVRVNNIVPEYQIKSEDNKQIVAQQLNKKSVLHRELLFRY